MALISRLSRLFTADVHAVLDRLEEPEVLLKQAIREMEEEVRRGEQQLQWQRHEQQQLEKQRDAGLAAAAELDSELDICFQAGEEALARALVKRKLMEAERTKLLTTALNRVAGSMEELSALLDDQRRKLAEMRHNAEILIDAAAPEPRVFEPRVSQEEVDIAFLREKQRRERP